MSDRWQCLRCGIRTIYDVAVRSGVIVCASCGARVTHFQPVELEAEDEVGDFERDDEPELRSRDE